MSRRNRQRRPGGRPASPTVDTTDLRLADAQRGVVLVLAFLVPLAVWPRLTSQFMMPKFTLLLLGLVVLSGLACARCLRSRIVHLPWNLAVGVTAAFLTALVVATVSAEQPVTALLGRQGRYAGLLTYLALLTVFLTTSRVFDARSSSRLIVAVLLGGLVVVLYGLLQVLGVDPLQATATLDRPVFSTLGNTNFASAYVAMAACAGLAAVVLSGWPLVARAAVAAGVTAALAYVGLARASQGPVVVLAGAGLVLVAWLLQRTGPRRLPTRLWLGALLGLGLLAAGVGVYLAPDLSRSLGQRVQFWEAALGVFADRPLLGAGLESFGLLFYRYRPPEHGLLRSSQGTDSAHNQVLGMLSNGGVLLGLAYLLLVMVIGFLLLQGLQRASTRQERFALAAFGAIWVGYHVQSLVSVDVPPLALLHWLSSGGIVAVAAPRSQRTLRLSRTSDARPRRAPRQAAVALALAGVVLVTTALGVAAVRPWRADAAAHAGGGRDGAAAVASLRRAVELAPWEPTYRYTLAEELFLADDLAAARGEAERAARLDPGNSSYAVAAGKLAQAAGDAGTATAWFDEALRRDPYNPALFEEAADFAVSTGDEPRARELRDQLAALRARYPSVRTRPVA